jgi:Fe-coproporphyrin III synthase
MNYNHEIAQFCNTTRRIVQIHPLLTCNLSCNHCYSSSGPGNGLQLKIQRLIEVIEDLASLKYEALSFSGGEPLLYKEINKALSHSKEFGLFNFVITNGILLSKEKISQLKKDVDLVAISLDGPPSLHNKIRCSHDAFERMMKGINNLRESGIKYGFIHTLTSESWEYIPWMADFAYSHGASLFHIHPLESYGRAKDMDNSTFVTEELLMKVYFLFLALHSKYADKMKIQYDYFMKDIVISNPELVYASDIRFDLKKSNPPDMIELVVEADGNIVPIAYGFSNKYAICNINKTRLLDSIHDYLSGGRYVNLRLLCKNLFKDLTMSNLDFFNWFELIINRSYMT